NQRRRQPSLARHPPRTVKIRRAPGRGRRPATQPLPGSIVPRRVIVDPRFGRRLRELREAASLSYQTLGGMIYRSHTSIWEAETGRKRPSPELAGDLDAALDAGTAGGRRWYLRAMADRYLGRHEQAAPRLIAGLDGLPPQIRISDWIGWYVCELAATLADAGERDRAVKALDEARQIADATGAARLASNVAKLATRLGV